HKTLPAFTQSAQLHLCSDKIDAAAVQNFLRIYESSSPSYVLLCGLSRCMEMLRDPATQDRIENYIKMLECFREKMQGLKYLDVLSVDDIGKIIISTKNIGMTGEALRRILAEKYRLELEMAGPAYALAMTSFMDEQCGFDRLAEALIEIDKNIDKEYFSTQKNSAAINQDISSVIDRDTMISQKSTPAISSLYCPQEKCLEIHEALEMPRESVPLAKAEGRICADYVCLYPPGIPILAPGERINAQTLENISQCIEQGLNVQGIDNNKIQAVTSCNCTPRS
ncbi:MAG: hypothetical protein LUI02_06475, partial [Clostridiales bacterium]|nr:hypothetical protein [Clostridiales bacterium]